MTVRPRYFNLLKHVDEHNARVEQSKRNAISDLNIGWYKYNANRFMGLTSIFFGKSSAKNENIVHKDGFSIRIKGSPHPWKRGFLETGG
jgi:hypothetical protein